MPKPITKAMLEAGAEAIVESLAGLIIVERIAADYIDLAEAVFRAMEAARDAEKVELSLAAKDLMLRLAMGEQPDFDRYRAEINELREHRLVEAGSQQQTVRWGIKGDLSPLPPGAVHTLFLRMFCRLTDKGAAYIAKLAPGSEQEETSNG